MIQEKKRKIEPLPTVDLSKPNFHISHDGFDLFVNGAVFEKAAEIFGHEFQETELMRFHVLEWSENGTKYADDYGTVQWISRCLFDFNVFIRPNDHGRDSVYIEPKGKTRQTLHAEVVDDLVSRVIARAKAAGVIEKR